MVAKYIARLQAEGIEVTEDWTKCEGYTRLFTPEENRVQAQKNMTAIMAADTLWLLAPDVLSEGSSTELGIAVALGKDVIVSGPEALQPNRIFYTLANHCLDDHEEAFDMIVECKDVE